MPSANCKIACTECPSRTRAMRYCSEHPSAGSCSHRRTGERTLRITETGSARRMMTMALADRPFLGSVRSALADRIRFCSRCGMVREERELSFNPPDLERVCNDCGMGVMLSAGRDALPGPGMSFLIVTEDLRISAVSEGAERIFGSETEMLGKMLFTAMTSPLGLEELALRIARAAGGDRDVILIPIELERGGCPGYSRLEARVSHCGPPRGALVAIEPLLT